MAGRRGNLLSCRPTSRTKFALGFVRLRRPGRSAGVKVILVQRRDPYQHGSPPLADARRDIAPSMRKTWPLWYLYELPEGAPSAAERGRFHVGSSWPESLLAASEADHPEPLTRRRGCETVSQLDRRNFRREIDRMFNEIFLAVEVFTRGARAAAFPAPRDCAKRGLQAGRLRASRLRIEMPAFGRCRLRLASRPARVAPS